MNNATIAFASGMTLFDALLPGSVIGGAILLALPWLDRESTIERATIISLSIFLMWRYMFWRITETIPPIENTLEYTVGMLFILVEGLTVIGATLSLFWMTRVGSRSKEADNGVYRLHCENSLPLIDVFICTYNESDEIVYPTIMGALDIDYPNKRVWVLDDGSRPWLQKFCNGAGCGYIARADNKHAKAGNINNGLRHVAGLDRQPDYIAILDADFVAQPALLERTLSLIHYDASVGLVQTPQNFFNPDPIQRNLGTEKVWPDEQRHFFDVVLTAKDAWSAAFCCGTSALIRYSALREIGGIPTESVTEDYLLSLCLRRRGYQTVYLNESLSVGLAPEGLDEYLTQRGRWCLGFAQIFRGRFGPFSTHLGISWVDRLTLIDTFLYWSATHAFRLLTIIIPAIYLLFDIKPVDAALYDTIDHVFPFLVVMILTSGWLTQWRTMPIMSEVGQLLSAHTVLKSVVVGLLFPKDQPFKVTLKGAKRKKRAIHWPMLMVYLGYLTLTLAAIVWAFVIRNDVAMKDISAIALVWCWYNMIILILACLICVEVSRQDRQVRAYGTVEVIHGNKALLRSALDVSLSDVRVEGRCSFEFGTLVRVGKGSNMAEGRITHVSEDDFTITFSHRTDRLKRLLAQASISPLHSGGLHPTRVAHAVLGRVFK